MFSTANRYPLRRNMRWGQLLVPALPATTLSPGGTIPMRTFANMYFRYSEMRSSSGRAVPPRLGAALVGHHRKFDQGDVGKLMGQFGHRPLHVIGRGDDDERTETAFLAPASRLDRVSDRVAGGMVEIDAAREQALIARNQSCQLARAGRGIDAGDEKPLAAARGQELDGIRDARRAAGQNDDPLGVAVERQLFLGNPGHEPEEADEQADRAGCCRDHGGAAHRRDGAQQPGRRLCAPAIVSRTRFHPPASIQDPMVPF